MKVAKKLIFFSVLMCFCMILFVGCTYSLPFTNKIDRYVGVNTLEQFSVIDEADFEDLTIVERKQLIAEKYISISFTVLIYEVEESTTEGITTTTKTQNSFGSGFIVHTGGYILTNNHVIESLTQDLTEEISGATTITTYYKCYVSQDGAQTEYEAQLLWSNSSLDMAIIICEEFADLEAAVLKDRTIFCNDEDKIDILEEIITVGTQNSLDYYATATTGEITSNLLRTAVSEDNVYEHLIQHDAAINHGNSGGALIDLDGNVIGLNTLGDDNANSLFFAISIYPAIAMLDIVVENYELYGETTEDLMFGFQGTDKIRSYYANNQLNFSSDGMLVVSVEPTCIISGLQANDVIIGVDITLGDKELSFDIRDQNTLLYARIWLLYAESGTVTVLRNGIQTTLSLNI
ncbi:MAG: S1C family serine protease [Clostridia bacterium]|nr:S1C family serine protease [Clostridia bacterium]